tara:strand:- start:287 stop:778 length:492 start_codon:yes stop_codon:yes gene_type:complete
METVKGTTDRSAISSRSETTQSAEQTQSLGAELAAMLRPGDVVALRGELGAGKTCLIQGICRGLQVEDVVNSPTFILVNEYTGRIAGRRIATTEIPVYHFDLYRLADAAELVDLGVEDYLGAGGVCLFEWAERADNLLPVPRWNVELEQIGEDERTISWTYGE